MGLVDQSDAIMMGWTFGGIALLMSATPYFFVWWGFPGYYFAIVLGGFMLVAGPIVNSAALMVIFASKNLFIATIEPTHVGAANIWWSHFKSVRIENPFHPTIPRFLTELFLLSPYYVHPVYGTQTSIFLEHNYGFFWRFWLRRGPATALGFKITHGHRDRIVLAEHDEPIERDWRKIPVYDVKRAGLDYFIEHGDILPEETDAPKEPIPLFAKIGKGLTKE